MRWACGITTAPRAGDRLLHDAYVSIQEAGWTDIVVSYDGSLPDVLPEVHLPPIENKGARGPWHNLRNTLRHLLSTKGSSEAFAIFQDDILVSSNCREYLESVFDGKFAASKAIYSLYTAMDLASNTLFPAFVPNKDLPMKAYGALGYVFPREVAKRLVANPPWPERARMADIAVGEFCRREGVTLMTHNPSLIVHMGEKSTCNPHIGLNQSRQCKQFWLDCSDQNAIVDVNGERFKSCEFDSGRRRASRDVKPRLAGDGEIDGSTLILAS